MKPRPQVSHLEEVNSLGYSRFKAHTHTGCWSVVIDSEYRLLQCSSLSCIAMQQLRDSPMLGFVSSQVQA